MRKDVRLGLAIGGSAIVIVACSVLFFRNPEPKPAPQAIQNPPAAPGAPVDLTGQGDATAQGTDTGSGTGAAGGTAMGTVNFGPSDLHGAGSTGAGTSDATGTDATLGTGTGTALGTGASDAMAGGTNAGTGSSWQNLLDSGAGTVTRTTTPGFGGAADIDGGGSSAFGGTATGGNSFGGTAMGGNSFGGTATDGNSFGGVVTPPVSAGPKTHIVEPGDTYWTIAQKEYGNGAYYTHIMRANPGVPANRLKAGVKLTIPDRSEVIPAGAPPVAGGGLASVDSKSQYRVQQGDNLYTICKKLYGKTDKVAKLYQLNKDLIGPNPSALKLNMVLQLPDAPATAETGTSVGTIQ